MPTVWEDVFRPALASWKTVLSPSQEDAFRAYARLVLAKNRSFNLTAAPDETELVRRHLLDGLAALPSLRAKFPGAAPRTADIGSGAGFIGLSLKIAWPQLPMTLVESVGKKAAFLRWAGDKLGLKGLEVVSGRAEALRAGGAAFDCVVERALAPLPRALQFCLPLTEKGGRFIAFQSDAAGPSPETTATLDSLRGRLEDTVPYRLPGEESPRFLLCFTR